jgi:hypothetical protein
VTVVVAIALLVVGGFVWRRRLLLRGGSSEPSSAVSTPLTYSVSVQEVWCVSFEWEARGCVYGRGAGGGSRRMYPLFSVSFFGNRPLKALMARFPFPLLPRPPFLCLVTLVPSPLPSHAGTPAVSQANPMMKGKPRAVLPPAFGTTPLAVAREPAASPRRSSLPALINTPRRLSHPMLTSQRSELWPTLESPGQPQETKAAYSDAGQDTPSASSNPLGALVVGNSSDPSPGAGQPPSPSPSPSPSPAPTSSRARSQRPAVFAGASPVDSSALLAMEASLVRAPHPGALLTSWLPPAAGFAARVGTLAHQLLLSQYGLHFWCWVARDCGFFGWYRVPARPALEDKAGGGREGEGEGEAREGPVAHHAAFSADVHAPG